MNYGNIFTILFLALPIYPIPVDEVHPRSVHLDISNLAEMFGKLFKKNYWKFMKSEQ